MKQEPDVNAVIPPSNLVVLAAVRPEAPPPVAPAACARQRLEDQFRQSFREQIAKDNLALSLEIEPAASVSGRTT